MLTGLFLSLFVTGYAGWYIAGQAKINQALGAVVGVFGHLPGVVVLAIIWAVKSSTDQSPPVKPA